MYAGAVIVPIIVAGGLGLSAEQTTYLVSVDIFMCGVATFLQVYKGKFTGIGLPVVLGCTHFPYIKKELEKISDNYLMELNKESKYVVFGPEPLFTYLVAKEREINAVRIIMVSKINNISSDKIRERLRETYA